MKSEQIDKAVQELLSLIDNTSRPASEVINSYTRTRRYIGSKDRRTLTEKVWQILRQRPTPKWLLPLIPAQELNAMQSVAPTILRVNGDRTIVQQQLSKEGVETTTTKLSPLGLVLTKRTNLANNSTFLSGLIEIQDEGSQLVALATKIQPKQSVLDYCAGAGGKSLCFAQMMHNTGKIVAHDVSKISLKELTKRANRAHITTIQTTQTLTGQFDHVVVDAPCSGSGTWRRAPDAKFKLTPQQLKNLVHKQAQILDKASDFVKKNGVLHYMTCSLIQEENQHQMQAFLHRHPHFRLVHHQQWTPAKTNTDGFFIASFKREM